MDHRRTAKIEYPVMMNHNKQPFTSARSLRFVFCASLSLCVTATAVGASFTVTGIIHTPTGTNPIANDVPAKYIKVIVMDEDILFDDVEGTGHTGTIGQFSISFVDNVENPDIFINVEYVGTGVSGQFIEVRAAFTDPAPILQENVEGVVHPDIPSGTFGIGTIRLASTRANIVTQIGDAVRFLQSTYPAWIMPENMNIEGRTTNGASFVAGDGSYVSIAFEDYNLPGAGNAAFSDIHHESFHWVAYRAYGNRWPAPTCNPGPHFANLESCEGFAMVEGSPQYFASVSHPDHKTVLPPNANTWWRGADGTGSNNSGEIVEGALEFVWRSLNDHPGAFQVFLTHAPDSMMEFKDGYASDQGSTSVATRTFLNLCAANGIVYTRGKLDGFTPGDPPDMAPPSDGNFKIIDSIAFARGDLAVSMTELTRPELRLATNSATVPADQKDLGVKPVVPGLAETNTSGFTFIGPVSLATDLIWGTQANADGDYDLLARTRSIHEWWDTFDPDFTGDTFGATDSTEKWLKTLQTWYNQDNVPDNDDEGKVVVDNTPPADSNFEPQ